MLLLVLYNVRSEPELIDTLRPVVPGPRAGGGTATGEELSRFTPGTMPKCRPFLVREAIANPGDRKEVAWLALAAHAEQTNEKLV